MLKVMRNPPEQAHGAQAVRKAGVRSAGIGDAGCAQLGHAAQALKFPCVDERHEPLRFRHTDQPMDRISHHLSGQNASPPCHRGLITRQRTCVRQPLRHFLRAAGEGLEGFRGACHGPSAPVPRTARMERLALAAMQPHSRTHEWGSRAR